MGSGEGWTNTWNFNTEGRSEQTLPGVTTYQGRVTSIGLSGNNLTGAFPVALLALPQLQSLDLSGNQLTGDVAALSGFPAEVSLTSLNISGNQFSGNIGIFAANLPNLTTLNASNNCLSDVDPMISTTVTTLNLSEQTMASVVNVDLATSAGLPDGFPSILLYNHGQQKYATSLSATGTATDGWNVSVYFRDSGVSLSGVAYQGENNANTYYGASGDQLQLSAENPYCSLPGIWYKTSTFAMKLSFAPGDANFNGKVDVTDLQGLINYAFDEYGFLAYHLFNFTAANLWSADEVINVSDVVKMVDLLLQIDDAAGSRGYGANGSSGSNGTNETTGTTENSQAAVYIKDGRLWIDTEVPVAAFELTLAGDNVGAVSNALQRLGFTCRTNCVGSVIRIVGYSMNGATIPVGETEICTLNTGNAGETPALPGHAQITQVVLSDANADAIPAAIEGTASGIHSIDDLPIDDLRFDSSAVYDLQGRKIENSKFVNRKSAKGVYIQNGTKIVNK